MKRKCRKNHGFLTVLSRFGPQVGLDMESRPRRDWTPGRELLRVPCGASERSSLSCGVRPDCKRFASSWGSVQEQRAAGTSPRGRLQSGRPSASAEARTVPDVLVKFFLVSKTFQKGSGGLHPAEAGAIPPPSWTLKIELSCETSLKNRILAPRWLKMALRWPLDGPQMAQDGPKMAQDGPRWPKTDPRWPKIAPRWRQDGPRWPKIAPRCPKMAPRWPKMAQDGLRWSKMAPRWVQMVRKWPQMAPS